MAKSSSKPSKRVVILSIILLIIGLSTPTLLRFMFNHTDTWKPSAEYKEYSEDFIKVKNYFAEEFPDESYKRLLVSRNGDQGIRLLDMDSQAYLDLPSDVLSSLEAIEEAFPDPNYTFDEISITEDKIAFCAYPRYALVYSPSQKPSCIATPKEDYKTKVKRIGDGWYHVVEKLK